MKKIFFVSDTHFGSLIFDDPIAKQRKFVAWLDSIKEEAEAIYLLGDMIDFWYEYKYCVPKGYTRVFGKIAELTDLGIPIHWFTGNHDIWLFDYVQKELGVVVHTQPLLVTYHGKKFLLQHGDGIGHHGLLFHFMRFCFHNRYVQRLFSAIHPWFGISLGLNWSAASRKMESKELPYLGEEKEFLIQYAKEHSKTSDIDFYVFGHRHLMLDLMISRQSRVIILGDWITYDSFGVWDGKDFSLEQVQ